ncbi:hypothetical protein GQ44DRAFT_587698, partial [Phaeosphaeriaceae sp. PMI808]
IGISIACRYWVIGLNDYNILVPIGCPGDRLIQGPIVAQGYLEDVKKTRETFIEPSTWTNELGSLDLSSERWYKIGDL